MRLTLDELKVAAVAARNFAPGYQCTSVDSSASGGKGNPCPALAITRFRTGDHATFNIENGNPDEELGIWSCMTQLLYHAAGTPSFTDRWNRPPHAIRFVEGYDPIASHWFQTLLHHDPSAVAALFDTIIICADPLWSSLAAPEEAPLPEPVLVA